MNVTPSNTALKANSVKPALNEFGFVEDGKMYWWASWYASVLGYKSLNTLEYALRKAQENCSLLGISIEENFIKSIPGAKINQKQGFRKPATHDYKLTKFACFLIAMQADRRKPNVKTAQLYFLNELEELSVIMKGQSFIQRKTAREEIRELNITLSKAAARAQVEDYSYFINEGFIGMYNKSVGLLKSKRGIPKDSNFYDHLGITELAANIFRIALTTERISRIKNPTEKKAAIEHRKIGAQIRSMIKYSVNTNPEFLPTNISLKKLLQTLKKTTEDLNKIETKQLHPISKKESIR